MRPITQKLSAISEIMADGVKFVHIRFFLEEMECRADDGDLAAKELCAVAERFLNLCNVVEKNK